MDVAIHHGALGDWILTWPLWRGWDRPLTLVTPGSRLRLLQQVMPEARHLAGVDIDAGEFWRLHGDGGDLPATTARLLAAAERIISFVSDGSDRWAKRVRRAAPQAVVAVVALKPASSWTGHVTQWYEHELGRQGVTVRLALPSAVRRRVGPVVIHPGSGGLAKCWPVERYLETARRLQGDGYAVRLVMGEAERDRWPRHVHSSVVGAGGVFCATLDELLSTIAPARLYLGNDAGPTHLAAQMGLPTVALFGPTSPAQWAPRGPAVTVLAPPRPTDITWLDTDSVMNTVRRLLSSS